MHLIAAGAALPRSVRVAAAFAVVALAIFGNLPNDTAFWRTLQDFAHCPAFVAISLILITLWPQRLSQPGSRWLPHAGTFVACLLVGVGIELAQSLIGGDVSAQDVFTDLAGTSIGLSWYALRSGVGSGSRERVRRRWVAFIGAAALVAALAPVGWMLAAYLHRDLEFPVLASFRSPLDLFFLGADESQRVIERLPSPLTDGREERGIRVALQADRTGVFVVEPVPDWSAYQTLAIDLANPSDSRVTLRLRVHDRKHNQRLNDRFNRTLLLPPHSRQTWRVPLADIRSAPATRPMDLRAIAGIGLFDPRPQAGEIFYLNRIWLERTPD